MPRPKAKADEKQKLSDLQGAHPAADVTDIQAAVEYLRHYGWIAGNLLSAAVSPILAVVGMAEALRGLQAVAGLPQTGQLDTATLETLNRPRCGVLDVQRLVEFAAWRKRELTYFVQSFVPAAMLSRDDQVSLIGLAWKEWVDVADVTLSVATTAPQADIIISTGRGSAQGFDGPSGTLAWAYLPNGSDGQLLMRFDVDERWGKDTGGSAVLFKNVACHEFGHLLGLDHSRKSGALMAPFYSPNVTKPQADDDIPRIEALYGRAKRLPPDPPPPPNPPGLMPRVTVELGGKRYSGLVAEV